MKICAAHTTRKRGFTLVELLVVIAIIGILAGIVVPNVTRYIRKGRVGRAVSEIRGADTALVGMLADAGRSKFRDFLATPDDTLALPNFRTGRQFLQFVIGEVNGGTDRAYRMAQDFYSNIFYDLLRNGKNASQSYIWDPEQRYGRTEVAFPLYNRDVLAKLGNSYQDLGTDPWGNRYEFWMGPNRSVVIELRSYRIPIEGENYRYTEFARREAQANVPGQPRVDGAFGFPAPRELPVYMYSRGANQIYDAIKIMHDLYGGEPEFLGGGDDPNNWDNQAGWNSAPE